MAIYRGAGGASEATDAATVSQVQTYAAQAATSATAAATSATSAASNATSAGSSASAAAASASSASSYVSSAASYASDAAGYADDASAESDDAAVSAVAALSYANAASGHATDANGYMNNAETYMDRAESAATQAAASAVAAAASITDVTDSADAAVAAAAEAADSATAAASSATAAANSASSAASAITAATASTLAAASASATAAANSATASATSASSSQAAADAALAALDSFDDRYLGQKSVAPTLDNDGNALVTGALYFNTVDNAMKVWDGTQWLAAYASLSGALIATNNLSDLVSASSARTNLGLATVASSGAYSDLTGAPTAVSSFTNDAGYLTSFSETDPVFTAWDKSTGISITESQISDFGSYEPADATILKDADIGVSVQAYDATILKDADIGVSVQAYDANTVAVAPGTAGNVLTSDGTNWTSAAPSGGGGSLNAIASGTLANGDTVIVNTDGTVSIVAQSIDATPVFGAEVVIENVTSAYNTCCYDSVNNVVVAFYANQNNYLAAAIGTISGSTITFGSPTVLVSNYSYSLTCCFDPSTGKIVVAYTNISNYLSAIVVTVSGSSISAGSVVTVYSGASYWPDLVYHSATQKVILSFAQNSSFYYGYATTCTISGTSISADGFYQYAVGSKVIYPSICYNQQDNRLFIAFRNSTYSNKGCYVTATVSGTSLSFSSWQYFTDYATYSLWATTISGTNKICISYKNATSTGQAYAIIGQLSEGSVSFGSEYQYDAGNTDYHKVCYDSVNEKLVFSINVSNTLKAYIGSVSGTVITFTSAGTFNGNSYDQDNLFDAVSGRVVLFYSDQSNSARPSAQTLKTQTATTNVTSENFIGFSDGDFSNGQEATVKIVGSVCDVLSGLTPGQSYYVQKGGSLGLTPDTPSVYAGTAVASTKLIVKG